MDTRWGSMDAHPRERIIPEQNNFLKTEGPLYTGTDECLGPIFNELDRLPALHPQVKQVPPS